MYKYVLKISKLITYNLFREILKQYEYKIFLDNILNYLNLLLIFYTMYTKN